MAAEPTETQLNWLQEQLHEPPTPLSDAEQQRILAEWRLDIQQPEARLMAELEHWQAPVMPEDHHWQLLLSGPALDAGQDEPSPPKSSALDTPEKATAYQMDSFASAPYQLLAWPAPSIADATSLALNRVAVSALQLALNQQNTWRSYRLIWQPVSPQNRLVLILNEPQVKGTTATVLPQLLTDEISDSLLLQAQAQLLEQLSERYSHPDFQHQWLELTAMLGLPIGSELTYATALQQLTADAIRQQLQLLLNADHQLSVTLKPF